MTRCSSFVVVGTLFTLSTVLFTSDSLFPGIDLYGPAGPLAAALIMVASFSFVAGMIRSDPLRQMALWLHLLTPMTWSLWLATSENISLSFGSWGIVAVIALTGSALSDFGIELDARRQECRQSREERIRQQLIAAARPILPTPPMAVCESGSLSIRIQPPH